MILPSKVVKKHNIDPSSVFLLLRSEGDNDLKVKILGEENLIENETRKDVSAEKVSEARSADTALIKKTED